MLVPDSNVGTKDKEFQYLLQIFQTLQNICHFQIIISFALHKSPSKLGKYHYSHFRVSYMPTGNTGYLILYLLIPIPVLFQQEYKLQEGRDFCLLLEECLGT